MKIRSIIIVTATMLNCTLCFGTTFRVGPTQFYTSPNALYLAEQASTATILDGDTIEIDAGTYTGTSSLAVWRANNLLIKGVGGKPHMKAEKQYIMGKGIWVAAGNTITVENIEFSGATVPDKNGAGIRVDGTGITVRHCYFHDNENGILTNNPHSGKVVVTYSEFSNNGFGDGYSHNIYIGHVSSFTLMFCYMHHAYIGHNVKSRADSNYILYNRIMDEYTGQSSMLIDLPNGGFSVILGNSLMQGTKAENKRMIAYGAEGLSNPHNELFVVNNTMLNERPTGTFVFVQAGTTTAKMINNLFIGKGDAFVGTTDTTTNLHLADTSEAGLLDPTHFNYNITPQSPMVNAGTIPGSAGTQSLTPPLVYTHPLSSKERENRAAIDIGAYELVPIPTTSIALQQQEMPSLYPNPVCELLYMYCGSYGYPRKIALYTLAGTLVQTMQATPHSPSTCTVTLGAIPSGLYCITVAFNNKTLTKILAIQSR